LAKRSTWPISLHKVSLIVCLLVLLFVVYQLAFVLQFLLTESWGWRLRTLQRLVVPFFLCILFINSMQDSVVPIFDLMWRQNLIPKFQFSTFLSSKPNASDSMLFLGGVDTSYFTGSFVWADVIIPSYWLVGMGTERKAHLCISYFVKKVLLW
jgi:hypothetical protein